MGAAGGSTDPWKREGGGLARISHQTPDAKGQQSRGAFKTGWQTRWRPRQQGEQLISCHECVSGGGVWRACSLVVRVLPLSDSSVLEVHQECFIVGRYERGGLRRL